MIPNDYVEFQFLYTFLEKVIRKYHGLIDDDSLCYFINPFIPKNNMHFVRTEGFEHTI